MDAVAKAMDGTAWLAVGVAFVAYFLLSFLWWSPIFGKKWAGFHGMDMDEQPPMLKPMLLQIVSTFLIAYVFWNVQAAFFVTHDADGLVLGEWGTGSAIFGAVMTWIGFFVPVKLGMIAWEQKPWGLFLIDVGGQLVGLIAMAVCFSLLS